MTDELDGYNDRYKAAHPPAQGSAEWLMQRVGYCTASRFADVIARTAKGLSTAKRDQYMMDLVCERLTGQAVEHYISKPMEWGIEQEAAARMAYEEATACIVDQVGFLKCEWLKWVGGSPDGLVDDDGMIEIKAPTSGTHLRTILDNSCDYMAQIQGLLMITGRKWCDFVSYDPRMPSGLQLYIQRIERDSKYIAMLETGIEAFLCDVFDMTAKLSAIAEKNAGSVTYSSANDITEGMVQA